MLVVALTGGIGSGKSTVANCFASLGVPIVDSDLIARDCVRAGSVTLQKISEHFGSNILTSSGDLDRKQLRHQIFSDASKRQWLEQLLHPLIHTAIYQHINQCQYHYVIVVIPLLLEVDASQRFVADRILVVDIAAELQLQRASQRDHQSFEAIQAIMKTQVSRQQRLQIADDIINNNTSLDDLTVQVQQLHQQYLLA